MRYEWDKDKRLTNLEKHGLDLADADLVYEHQQKLTVPCKTTHEERWQDFAEIDGILAVLTCVYTRRNDAVRFISFRYASRKERKAYYGTDR